MQRLGQVDAVYSVKELRAVALLSIALALGALVACAPLEDGGNGDGVANPSFRMVPIPERENGYAGFESTVVASGNELDSFLATTDDEGWNARGAFEQALSDADIDFGTEALVLLRHTEGSGSTVVDMMRPRLQGDTLVADIRGQQRGEIGTTDMAFYCYAVVVSKKDVRSVELRRRSGGQAKELPALVMPIPE